MYLPKPPVVINSEYDGYEDEYNRKGKELIHAVVPNNPGYKEQIGSFINMYVEYCTDADVSSKITGMLIDLPMPRIRDYLINYRILEAEIRTA